MGRSCIKEQMPASNKLEGKTQDQFVSDQFGSGTFVCNTLD